MALSSRLLNSVLPCVMFSIFVVGITTRCPGEELPKDAKSLIYVYGREVAASKKKLSKETSEWRSNLTKKLKTLQQSLAEADKLEEAISVRDLIKTFETGKAMPVSNLTPEQRAGAPRIIRESLDTPREVDVTQIPKEMLAALPKEAQAILLENEFPGDEIIRLDTLIQEKSIALRMKLAELQSAHTKKGELDEAAAIRDWMQANLKMNPPNNSLVDAAEVGEPQQKDIALGAKDFAEIQANYQAANQEMNVWYYQMLAEPANRLFESLKAEQSRLAKAGQLEEALALRDLLKELSTRPSFFKVTFPHSRHPSMPKDAQKLVNDFLTEVKPIDERRDAILADLNTQLNNQMLQPAKDKAKTFLIKGDREMARRALMELYARLNEPFPDLREPLKVSGEVQELLDQFLEETQKRMETVDETESPLREALLEKLREARERNLKANEEIALDNTIAYLENENHFGLRGLILFRRSKELKGDLAEMVDQFATQIHAEFLKLQEQHRLAFETLRSQFEEIRKAQTEAEEWKAAFSTLCLQEQPPQLFDPIPVTYYRFPNTGGIAGHVIAVRNGIYRVRDQRQNVSWGIREEIRVGDEPVPDPKVENRPTPGDAVTQRTKLQPGQLVMTKSSFTYEILEVLDPGPSAVKVRYADGFHHEDTVDRSLLRIMPDE